MKIQTKENILSTIKRSQDKIMAFGVKRLGIFGSFVREEQNEKSDVDLLVEFEQDKKPLITLYIFLFLEGLIKHRIELVTVESLSPYIKPYIIKEVEYIMKQLGITERFTFDHHFEQYGLVQIKEPTND